MADFDVEERHGELVLWKLPKLQRHCNSLEISTEGTKIDLIERIIKYDKEKHQENLKDAILLSEQVELEAYKQRINETERQESDHNSLLSINEQDSFTKSLESVIDKRIERSAENGIIDLSSAHDGCGVNFNLSEIPTGVLSSLKNTKQIDASNICIKELWLTNNRILYLPSKTFSFASHLQTLCLSGNRLRKLPDSLTSLTNLKRLVISRNKLNSFPSKMEKLTKLVEIYANHNQFPEFPKSILKLTGIRNLHLSHNLIKEIPTAIKSMRTLVDLNLDHNKISIVPGDITTLSGSLKQLGLAHNHLAEEPAAIRRLINLKVLRLSGNRAKALGPLEIRNDGFAKTAQTVHTSHGSMALPVGGYVAESVPFNISAGSWYKSDDYDAVPDVHHNDVYHTIKSRAKHRPWVIKTKQ